jgi:metallo-beta-lactamase class B
MTGARVVSSAGDAPSIETGGKRYWAYGDSYSWQPCPVDQVVVDGESVSLGGTALVAHVTPGHSRGATTWTTTIEGRSNEGGTRPLAVVFYPGTSTPPGAQLADHSAFGEAVYAYKHSLGTWKSLPCDVFLGSYGETFGLEHKWTALKRGVFAPFVDPDGYARTIAVAESKFELQIDRDR